MSTAIVPALIRADAKAHFAEHCEGIQNVWARLLDQSSLPYNASSTDDRVLDKIRTLDDVIRRPTDPIISRLAYVQLTWMLAALKKKISDDRKQGLIIGKRSRRDATEAVDIYLNAIGRGKREDICKLTRRGNRWAAIAGRYPLLLVALTDDTERIISHAYTIFAASVLAANSVIRSLFGAAFPLFTSYMYKDLGIHWASSIPGFLALACVPFPFLFYKYGPAIRERCKYAAQSAAFMRRLQAAQAATVEEETRAGEAGAPGGAEETNTIVDNASEVETSESKIGFALPTHPR
ncbi:hypothetical protein DL768_006568 [Monosporascus sp. mg162]|nr:hypothetical protein DL768_006568 [Monosporascus sp. mg162]